MKNSEIELLASNFIKYRSMEEYLRLHNMDMEEFTNEIENGWIENITCGTYNGASDTFDSWNVTPKNIVKTLLNEYNESEFESEILEKVLEDNGESVKEYSLFDKLETFEDYARELFIIDGNIYMDIG